MLQTDVKTVLNWFGVVNPTNQNLLNDNVNNSTIESMPASDLSLETLQLIVKGSKCNT